MVVDVPPVMDDGPKTARVQELFRTEHAALMRIARSILHDPTRAEDAVQEVFLTLLSTRRPPARDAERVWLQRCVAHRALNVLREEGRRTTRQELSHRRDALPLAAPDPSDEVERRDERRRVRQALLRLPRRDAMLLVLRHSGRSYVELSEALHIPIAQIGTRLRRAEARLRREFTHATPD